MVSVETIREQFDELGIEPSDEIINKCIDICINNDINDPVEFVEQWMAYSVSKLGGAEPTVAFLNEMEAHEYTSKSSRKAKVSSLAGAGLGSIASPRLDTKVSKITTYRNVDSTEQDVLEMYGCITPKNKKSTSRLQHNKNTPECIRGGGSAFTTVTYSPLSTLSKKVDPDVPSRTGQVVYTYGNAQLLKQINWLPSGSSDPADAAGDAERKSDAPGTTTTEGSVHRTTTGGVNVSFQATQFVTDGNKYMFDSSYDRVMILGDRIYEIGNAICSRLIRVETGAKEQTNGTEASTMPKTEKTAAASIDGSKQLKNEEEMNVDVPMDHEDDAINSAWFEGVKVCHVNFPSSDPIRVLGRIVAEQSAATQKKTSDRLYIVDFDENTLRQTRLDLSKVAVPGWSLFPGQTVLLEGINPRGSLFSVQKIHHERTLTLPRTPMGLERPVTMVIASAPFTDRDDLLYEKLSGLLQYCSTDPPDVLLLTGPFADASCKLYTDVAEPFQEYFEKIIATIMNAVGGQTEVCIVANHDDVVSTFVYPTQPYKVASFYKNLHLLPDPCLFNVEGLEIGVTTVDIIKQLVDTEFTAEGGGVGGDKIKRAYNHVFHQASFYPLNPPPEDVPLDVDLSNEFGRLNRVPNVMVCPSALNRYVREINRCVCINPGFVDNHSSDGSYARLIIHPPDPSSISSSCSGASQQDIKGSASQQPSPASYIACQIIKT